MQLEANVLVGSNKNLIVQEAKECLLVEDSKAKLRRLPNPFGDGDASKKIVDVLKRYGSTANKKNNFRFT